MNTLLFFDACELFFENPYEYHMDVCNDPSCVAKTLMLDIASKLFKQFFHTCYTYRHH